MEREVKINEINKLKIYENSLDFLVKLLDFDSVYFLNDIEIEPFNCFSSDFSSEYWFLKYYLLKTNKFLIEDNFIYLFQEVEINIIFLTLSDIFNFNLNCIDGTWYLEIIKKNEITKRLVENLIKLKYL